MMVMLGITLRFRLLLFLSVVHNVDIGVDVSQCDVTRGQNKLEGVGVTESVVKKRDSGKE